MRKISRLRVLSSLIGETVGCVGVRTLRPWFVHPTVRENLGTRHCSVNSLPVRSRLPCSIRLFENRFVGLALRRRPPAGEVGVKRLEGELAAVGSLELQRAVTNDPGAVLGAAGGAAAGADRAKDVGDCRGAVGLHIFDNQGGA